MVEKPWGTYKVIECTKIITINPNQELSLQYHKNRDEFWKVTRGSGRITINNQVFFARSGDCYWIYSEDTHHVKSYENGMEIYELSSGDVDENDIVRLSDKYNRFKIITITSGYFDPLHAGHVDYLKQAKKLSENNYHIVIVNNDQQCLLKKGRHFMPQNERKYILEQLRYVDEVLISIDNDETVCKSIEYIRNIKSIDCLDFIFAKGGDRFINEIPETEICNKLGIKLIDGFGTDEHMHLSSSKLLKNYKE